MKNKYTLLSLNVISIILMAASLQMGWIGPGGKSPWTVFENNAGITSFNLILIIFNLISNYLIFSNNKLLINENGKLKRSTIITFYITNGISILFVILGYTTTMF